MASQDTCRHEMFVMMQWERPGLAVPLSQLKPISNTDRNTK
ncbi:MAG: calcium-binding protein [Phycisphaerae bacterium]|nr:calcium-binding protein [Phycisphaerae bacterium]